MTAYGITSSGSGSVASFSSGNLSPLFTTSVANSTTNPALSFSLSNVAAHKWLGNATGSTGAPSYSSIDTTDISNFSSKIRGLFASNSPISYSNGFISADTSTGGSHLATQYYVSQHSGTGSITSITATAPLTGGTITTSGSIGVDTSAGGSHLATQYYVDSHAGGSGDMTKAVYDPIGLNAQVLVTPTILTVDQAQVFDLSVSGVVGMKYIIYSGATTLPTGIDHVTVTCTLNDAVVPMFDVNAMAYLPAFGHEYPCTYDVATNKINVILSYEALITQTGTADPVITEIKNDFVSCTFTPAYSAIGTYTITPSYGLISLFTAMWMDNGGTVGQDGIPSMGIRFFNVAYNVSDFIDIASWKFSTTDFALQDDILLNSKIVLYGQIKN